MAMPFIIHHCENIYSLDEPAVPASGKHMQPAMPPPPPRYISKHRTNVACEPITAACGRKKALHATMGYAQVPLDQPDQYLRCGGGVKPMRPAAQHRSCAKLEQLPPLPNTAGDAVDRATVKTKHACGPVTNDSNRRDDNGKVASGKRAVFYRPRFVDTKHGATHDLKYSGLQPVYVYQPTFGKLPNYLIKRIRDAALRDEMVRDAQVRKQPLCRYVTQEERAELLGVSVKTKDAPLPYVFMCIP